MVTASKVDDTAYGLQEKAEGFLKTVHGWVSVQDIPFGYISKGKEKRKGNENILNDEQRKL